MTCASHLTCHTTKQTFNNITSRKSIKFVFWNGRDITEEKSTIRLHIALTHKKKHKIGKTNIINICVNVPLTSGAENLIHMSYVCCNFSSGFTFSLNLVGFSNGLRTVYHWLNVLSFALLRDLKDEITVIVNVFMSIRYINF